MNRKRVYLYGFLGFLLMWGLFGSIAAAPRGAPRSQVLLIPGETTASPVPTPASEIPVTGDPEPVWTEIVVFYGLIALTALFLILGLLKVVSRTAASYSESEVPPSRKDRDG